MDNNTKNCPFCGKRTQVSNLMCSSCRNKTLNKNGSNKNDLDRTYMPEEISYDEIESYGSFLVQNHRSFFITNTTGVMSRAVNKIESIIEAENMRCRVYTVGRSAVAGASMLSGVGGLIGIASTIGIVTHNLATWDPDYEIGKHQVDNKLSIK